MSLEARDPQILVATNKARDADALEAVQEYQGAFELYKAAVSTLIPLIDSNGVPEGASCLHTLPGFIEGEMHHGIHQLVIDI